MNKRLYFAQFDAVFLLSEFTYHSTLAEEWFLNQLEIDILSVFFPIPGIYTT
ncbi:hypothetical protein SD78_1891 [Bacillus badius]|nr:hypothetical protein SD78_1891 [Bacillus badius]